MHGLHVSKNNMQNKNYKHKFMSLYLRFQYLFIFKIDECISFLLLEDYENL